MHTIQAILERLKERNVKEVSKDLAISDKRLRAALQAAGYQYSQSTRAWDYIGEGQEPLDRELIEFMPTNSPQATKTALTGRLQAVKTSPEGRQKTDITTPINSLTTDEIAAIRSLTNGSRAFAWATSFTTTKVYYNYYENRYSYLIIKEIKKRGNHTLFTI